MYEKKKKPIVALQPLPRQRRHPRQGQHARHDKSHMQQQTAREGGSISLHKATPPIHVLLVGQRIILGGAHLYQCWQQEKKKKKKKKKKEEKNRKIEE